jgi:putative lipoic acid-binding regulatory protein
MVDDTSDEPKGQGFQFPGVFEIMAAGPAEAQLEQVIPRELAAAGLVVMQESVRSRASSSGRYVSVTVSFRAESREQYDAAHHALRAHPDVKWTL